MTARAKVGKASLTKKCKAEKSTRHLHDTKTANSPPEAPEGYVAIPDKKGGWQMVRAMRVPEYMMKNGKMLRQKPWQEPTETASRKSDATEIIEALADAARAIGNHKGTGKPSFCTENGEWLRPFSHLWPRHLLMLMPDAHPAKATYAKMEEEHQNHHTSKGQSSRARIPVYWEDDDLTSNEYRSNPLEIVGLLMRRVIDGDAPFFDEMADQIRRRKTAAQKMGDKQGAATRAGKIIAKAPSLMGMGDPDWFTRIAAPRTKGKIPHIIWTLCRERHKAGAEPPTRREIRDRIEAKGTPCKNLRASLFRMGLNWLKEGQRPKRSI